MDVGLSVASQIPGLTGRPLIDAIGERAAAARRAGLSSLHVGDKHGVTDGYAANFVLAGRLAAEWRDRLGVLVVSTMWNPVLLAEQIATLAASVQRLEVVVALGDGENHFASVGLSMNDRLGLFLDGLAVTRALVSGETVSAVVGPYVIRNAHVATGAGCDVSWWIAASSPRAIERAAETADGWLGSAKLKEHEAIAAVEHYRGAGGTGRAVLRRDVFVGESRPQVDEIAEPVVAAGHRDYPPEALVRGDLVDVAQDLRRFESAGFDEVLARSLVSKDQTHALASIARLAEVAAATR